MPTVDRSLALSVALLVALLCRPEAAVAASARPPAAAVGSVPAPRLILPAPSGSAAVGTLIFELPADRRLVVQVWYPADRTGSCVHLPYMDARTAHAKTGDGEAPRADLSIAVGVNACAGAPPASSGGPLPVVLFSHGLGATRFSYQSLYEDLASRGYAVVAIQHPSGSRYTAYADGSFATFDAQAWSTENESERQRRLDRGLSEWLADGRAVLARLERLKAGDRDGLAPLAGRLDLTRLGYAGHSFGGTTAMLAAKSDPRIRAVANLDGRFPAGENQVLTQPLLALLSIGNPGPEGPPGKTADVVARIAGASHTTFGDQALIAETFDPPPGGLDPAALDGLRGIALTRTALGAFFDCTLLGNSGRCVDLRTELARASVPAH